MSVNVISMESNNLLKNIHYEMNILAITVTFNKAIT